MTTLFVQETFQQNYCLSTATVAAFVRLGKALAQSAIPEVERFLLLKILCAAMHIVEFHLDSSAINPSLWN